MSVSRFRASVPLKFAAVVASLTCVAPSMGFAQLATPAPSLTQTVPYTAAFTPGSALPLVLDTIRNARSTLLVAAYAFTSRPVAIALRDAQRRGVRVFVVIDADEAAKAYSAARFLTNGRVPIRTNARYAQQHNKFIVADGTVVQTGSFNYTSSAAQRNAENVLVVRNAPALAAQYGAEWQKLWDEGIDLRPGY
ncbi:phospholipase D family nuclease [Variovorax guangxiensis]|uniref:phospholipase D n=1 Tax=Variovorax guangxiensis TaxID=1775474 RepID=A0A840FZ83_9BURK|nr:phospholipase D family protein [Variovorax guangxiensis]MBB4225564.1 phosphatidylserine/phosphatidylglycerophosphate/cardiolipin synthase-like enzyme [Variovorax guangxiensis]